VDSEDDLILLSVVGRFGGRDLDNEDGSCALRSHGSNAFLIDIFRAGYAIMLFGSPQFESAITVVREDMVSVYRPSPEPSCDTTGLSLFVPSVLFAGTRALSPAFFSGSGTTSRLDCRTTGLRCSVDVMANLAA
jgi:hypothetical protein